MPREEPPRRVRNSVGFVDLLMQTRPVRFAGGAFLFLQEERLNHTLEFFVLSKVALLNERHVILLKAVHHELVVPISTTRITPREGGVAPSSLDKS